MEKIFYNGNLRSVIEPFDAIYVNSGVFAEQGYVGDLKTKHPASIMVDVQNGFLVPCYVGNKSKISADFLVFNQNPFESENLKNLKLVKTFKNGEELIVVDKDLY